MTPVITAADYSNKHQVPLLQQSLSGYGCIAS